MVNHARALVLRDRNHPAVIRWSQANEPNQSGQDSEQFEKDLYAAINGADGTRPVIVELGVGGNVSLYPGMTYANFAVIPHYVDGFGRYGEGLITVNGRPDGEGEYIWPACNNKQGFEWFATATLAKRGKDATDLRPYTLLSAWASVVPGVRTTDFTPEEGGHPIYGADNLPDPWSNPQIQRVQAAFNPVAAVDLPYWSASGASDSNGTFPLPQAVPSYARNATVTRNITVFNDDLTDTSVGFTWTARLDSPTGTVVASGSTTLTIPLGSRVTQPVSFTTPATGSRVYLQLSTAKSGSTVFTDAVEYFTLGGSGGTGPAPGTYRIVNRNSGKPLAIAGNSTADGAKAVQQSGTPTWTISTTQDAYTLRYTASGKVLDVNAGSSTVGLQLQQWSANGGTNQMWYLRPTGDGYYTIVSRNSGLAGRRLRRVDQRRGAGRAVDRQRRDQPAVAVRTRLTENRGGCQARPPVTDCRLLRRLGGTVCAPESAAIRSRWDTSYRSGQTPAWSARYPYVGQARGVAAECTDGREARVLAVGVRWLTPGPPCGRS